LGGHDGGTVATGTDVVDGVVDAVVDAVVDGVVEW